MQGSSSSSFFFVFFSRASQVVKIKGTTSEATTKRGPKAKQITVRTQKRLVVQ